MSEILIPPPLLSAGYHPARRLAVPAFHPELPRCGGASRRARARCLVRDGAQLGAEIRADYRTKAAVRPSAAEQSLASRRCVTNTRLKEEVWCCTRDEGRPLEASGQARPQTPASCDRQERWW